MGILKSIELKGLLRSLLYGMIACIIASAVMYFSSIQESLSAVIGRLILIASVFYAAGYVTKSYGNKGLIRGITMGVMFYIVLLIASLIFHQTRIDVQSYLLNLLICLGSGAIGGILGLGLNNN
jgi:putative membrane protein (TIGR04086 family)